MIAPNRWLVALSRPLRWRSPRSTARMLVRFAEVERASFYDLMAAANRTTDPQRRAQYLAHALDERRHADAFAARAVALDPDLRADPRLAQTSFEGLFDQMGERRFLAFVHHGERRGVAQMRQYRRELAALAGTRRADPETLALFDAVIADEDQHEAYTHALCRELGASSVSAVTFEFGRAWRRAGRSLAEAVFTGVTMALYVLLAPLAWIERRRAR